MSTIAEREREQNEVRLWLDDINRLSREMVNGSLESFSQLVDKLVGEEQDGRPAEYEPKELTGRIERKTLATLFIAERFSNVLRENFGMDNIGFPEEEGLPIVKRISRSLGEFIQASVFDPTNKEDPMEMLGRAIEGYEELIRVDHTLARRSALKVYYHI